MDNIEFTPEEGINSPEQEIKDVFRTTPDNKIWQPGDPLSDTDWKTYLQSSMHNTNVSDAISLDEARRQIEQIKAFQTHGS